MYGWTGSNKAKVSRAFEVSGACDGSQMTMCHGLMTGTRVASNLGWRAVEKLEIGDKVLTFDNGVQPIVEIKRAILWTDATEVSPGFWPMMVPSGALGNIDILFLLPDQGVMLENEGFQDPMADPFAVVPAQALEGMCGIHRSQPQYQMELITLFFAHDEVIYIDGGLLIHCPRSQMSLHGVLSPHDVVYDVLSPDDAQMMLAGIDLTEQSLTQSGGYVFGATEMGLVA